MSKINGKQRPDIHQVVLRMTPSQHADIKDLAKAAGMSMNKYVIALIFGELEENLSLADAIEIIANKSKEIVEGDVLIVDHPGIAKHKGY